MTEYSLQLFKKIYKECIITNNLRPEYEMWLTQEVFLDEEQLWDKIYDYLKQCDFDTNGWRYWFLYKMITHNDWNYLEECSEDNKIEISEYLQKCKECDHKYGKYEWIISHSQFGKDFLEEELKNGNGRAAYALAEISPVSYSRNYIKQGIELKDFACVYAFITEGDIRKHRELFHQTTYKTASNLALEWGYHSSKNLLQYVEKHERVSKKLIDLGIPCGYYYLSYTLDDTESLDILKQKVNVLNRGHTQGCCQCTATMNEPNTTYDYVSQLIQENERLKQLQTLSLEDCVKNVISEYI